MGGERRGLEASGRDFGRLCHQIRQIQAVEAALSKVSTQILDAHLNSCVITAVQGEDPAERQRVLKEILEVFEMSAKV